MRLQIDAVLHKAAEKLRVAEMLAANGAWDDAASRAYYAAFHAISALHLSQGNTFSSHAQSIGRFNKDFVRTGIFPIEFTAILTRLFEDRQSGDYDLSGLVSAEEAVGPTPWWPRLMSGINPTSTDAPNVGFGTASSGRWARSRCV